MEQTLGLTPHQWQAVSAIATLVLVVITGVYALLTYLMVREVRLNAKQSSEIAEAQLHVEFALQKMAAIAPYFHLSCKGASVIVRGVSGVIIRLDDPKQPQMFEFRPLGFLLAAELREGNDLPLIAPDWPELKEKMFVTATIVYAFSSSGPEHRSTVTLHHPHSAPASPS